ncbi:SDR family NAD(P)-dependent oxidoreductase [Roseateles amylovorans]|uniref:SDR family NAD(P)-dependent oxidoreductase n=1 Tax=Roseateles amylovorans TaxID=2978473 RepID=A0ABY6B6Z3_9BURK|nr:SDR family NAD(P)-dependent oxidoreductase [Roseateles amylovorans]UXH80531.1 SDR family NAD(P)-dependent oxidoreductase [Roseateles amylovorans]
MDAQPQAADPFSTSSLTHVAADPFPDTEPAALIALRAPIASGSLQGGVALIAGGSRGLGAAIAQVLGETGMRVVLTDTDLQRAQDCAAVLGERGIQVLPLALDGGDASQCATVVDAVVRQFGRLDALIQHASVDASAPLAMTRPASAQMLRQGTGGHIVNISYTTTPGWPEAGAGGSVGWGRIGRAHALHATVGDPKPLRFSHIDDSRLRNPLQVARAVREALMPMAPTLAFSGTAPAAIPTTVDRFLTAEPRRDDVLAAPLVAAASAATAASSTTALSAFSAHSSISP